MAGSSGQFFITHADLTQLSADAVVLTTSSRQQWNGNMAGAFRKEFDLEALWQDARNGANLRNIGDSAWLPVSGPGKPYGIVVTVCTEASREAKFSIKERRTLPVKASIHKSFDELRKSGKTHRLLIALPLLRLGQGGDHFDTLASAQHQIVAAREALDQLKTRDDWLAGADVVFVAYTYDHYQVFLEARRQVGQRPNLSVPLPENFDSLLHAVQNDECVLFVGAGMSVGAGHNSYNDLIDGMAAKLGEKPPTDDQGAFLDVAQWFREEKPDAMGNLIADVFGPHNKSIRPTLAHYSLLASPIQYIVTTNYDSLLERALNALRRFPVKVITDAEIAQTGRKGGTFVVKMHGDAEYCKGKDDSTDGIVISRDDYDRFFTKKPMMASLLEGLLLNRTFLFVGYSLRDPNFRQIYAKIAHTLREAQQPAFAITFEKLSKPALQQWNNKQVYPITIPGANEHEQNMNFNCLLDHIAEKAAGNTHVWLAPSRDAETEATRSPLEQTLLALGNELVSELTSTFKVDEERARRLYRTLIFLTEQGWRPRKNSLAKLYKILAIAFANPEERERCLIRALAHAERADDIDSLITSLTGMVK